MHVNVYKCVHKGMKNIYVECICVYIYIVSVCVYIYVGYFESSAS